MDAFDGLVRETIVLVALLCFPVLGVATGVGMVVAIVQAATQVQEQTIALFPKMLAVGIFLVAFGSFGLRLCASLFAHVIAALPDIVRGAG